MSGLWWSEDRDPHVGSCRPLSRYMVVSLHTSDEDGLSRPSLQVSRDTTSNFGLLPVNGVVKFMDMNSHSFSPLHHLKRGTLSLSLYQGL